MSSVTLTAARHSTTCLLCSTECCAARRGPPYRSWGVTSDSGRLSGLCGWPQGGHAGRADGKGIRRLRSSSSCGCARRSTRSLRYGASTYRQERAAVHRAVCAHRPVRPGPCTSRAVTWSSRWPKWSSWLVRGWSATCRGRVIAPERAHCRKPAIRRGAYRRRSSAHFLLRQG
jgi:hypothetical protein